MTQGAVSGLTPRGDPKHALMFGLPRREPGHVPMPIAAVPASPLFPRYLSSSYARSNIPVKTVSGITTNCDWGAHLAIWMRERDFGRKTHWKNETRPRGSGRVLESVFAVTTRASGRASAGGAYASTLLFALGRRPCAGPGSTGAPPASRLRDGRAGTSAGLCA